MRAIRLLLLCFLMPSLSFAGVNLKNGNFYISYTDIIVPGGGMDLEITRTNNSKSTEKGWFGFGWGSDFETYVTVSADGSVIVHENGSGALTRFTPKASVDAGKAAKNIVAAIRKRSSVNDKFASDLLEKLKNDAELRQAYARKYKVSAKIANGTELFSNTRGLQKLVKAKSGFVRIFNDGKKEYFNKDGYLEKRMNKNGYTVNLNYKKGRLVSIKDSQAKQLFFEWYPDKKVKHIYSAGDKKTHYKYRGDDLIESKDIAGNVFKYDYDGNHNMNAVIYTDKSKLKISYTPKTQFVEEVVSRNGESTKYKYESNPKNPEFHYWTTVAKKSPSGKASKSRYEYEVKSRPDGSQYTYRIATEINGIGTETIYSECCSLPLKITRGNNTTTFEYNKKGLLTNKSSTKGESVQLEYHPKFNKITKVLNNRGSTKFDYDDRANLVKATNDKGKSVMLFYDSKGRIQRMYDKDRKTNKTRVLTFEYNALGKPVEIQMKGVGKINVAYDNYGEIKKVESKQGHKMALQVTQAFQSLLAIVKPAGVNLNM
jgi:YD repeat-containing protein